MRGSTAVNSPLIRSPARPSAKLWPIRLRQRLPVIDIPLRAPDADAKLDLRTVLDTAYDDANYDLQIDYTQDPSPLLPPSWRPGRMSG